METALLPHPTVRTAAQYAAPEHTPPEHTVTEHTEPGPAVAELLFAGSGVIAALRSLLSDPRMPGLKAVFTIWKMPTHEQLPAALRGECILQVSWTIEQVGNYAILEHFVRSSKPVSYQVFAAEGRAVSATAANCNLHSVPRLPATAVPALIAAIRANPLFFSLEITMTPGDVQIVSQWAGDAIDPMTRILAAII